MDTKTYHAIARPDDYGWWTVEIPELAEAGPDGRNLIAPVGAARSSRQLNRAAHELAALILDLPIDQVTVEVEIEAPAEANHLWVEGNKIEADARVAAQRGAEMRRQAVQLLRDQGYTTATIGQAFGISQQRVHQISAATH